MTRKEMIVDAYKALSAKATRSEIHDWILDKYEMDVPEGTIAPALAEIRQGEGTPKGQLKGADESELRDVLLDMGFSINGDLVSLDGDRWSQFIDEQIALTNQSIGGVPQSEAEFPLEAVKDRYPSS